jgi:hypothetical protein
MKQKLIISLSVLLLIGVLLLIARDLFVVPKTSEKNPCEYNMDKLKAIDTSIIKYKEIKRYKPGLSSITGIAIDINSMVYLVGSNVVQVYDKEWNKKLSFNIDSSANCIAVGTQNDIYLGMGNHIEKYNLMGLRIKRWSGLNNKGFITSVAVANNQIFAADAGNHVVLRFDPLGNLMNLIGKKNVSKGIDGLVVPSMYLDVAIDHFDDLWVANPGRHELESFSASGDFKSAWGISSMRLEGFAGCCNPVHFAIMPNGYFVTYEKGLDRIKIYNQAGIFTCVVAGPESFSNKSDLHCNFASLVNDLTVDSKGIIYLLDAYTNEIRLFDKK